MPNRHSLFASSQRIEKRQAASSCNFHDADAVSRSQCTAATPGGTRGPRNTTHADRDLAIACCAGPGLHAQASAGCRPRSHACSQLKLLQFLTVAPSPLPYSPSAGFGEVRTACCGALVTAPFQKSFFDTFFQFCDCSFPNGSPGRELLYRKQYEHTQRKFYSHAYIDGVCCRKTKTFAAPNECLFRFRWTAVPLCNRF